MGPSADDDHEPAPSVAWTATASGGGPPGAEGADDWSPVDRIGRFAILRILGQGGMGRVLVGYDEPLDRKVAIKLLRWPDQHDGDRARARLMREAKALARLSHPNVVQVHETGAHGDAVFIAMELVEGQTLGDWSGAQDRAWEAILDVLIQAGRGLEAAHRAGMVHRDFKPDNVIVGEDGRARVLDFGLVGGLRAQSDPSLSDGVIARSPEASGASQTLEPAPPLGASLTVEGSIMGTPVYMAPEQHEGRPCDDAADQFAFCVSAFEALFGVRPFDGRPMIALALAKQEGRMAPIPPDTRVPRAVRDAILRGLAASPAERWPDMGTLLGELEHAVSARRRRWRVPALGGALLVGALGAFTLTPRSETEPCTGVGEPIERTWSTERREASLQRLPVAGAPATVERLDRWANDWTAAARHSCEDVHVRQLLSAGSLDRRGACLGRRLATFDALTEAIIEGRIGDESASTQWLGQLEDPSTCLTEAVLQQRTAPIPREHATEIATLRRDLVRVDLERTGQTMQARLELAERLLARSRELGWAPLVGEAALTLGRLHTAVRDGVAARSRLGEAIDIGADALDIEQQAKGWSAVNQVERLVEFDVERARWAWQREQAVLGDDDASPQQRAQLLVDRGQTEELAGEVEAAERSLRDALALLDEIEPVPAWQRATVLRNLGNLLTYTSRAEQAQPLFEQARALELGSEADALPSGGAHNDAFDRLDEAIAIFSRGDHEAALAAIHENLAAASIGHGPRSEIVARHHVVLAAIHDELGRTDELRTHARLADQISLEAVGPLHPLRTDVLSAVGVAALRDERVPDAVRAFEGALRVIRRIKPDDSLEVAHAEYNLADALHQDGNGDRAVPLLAHAIGQFERRLDEDDPLLEETNALMAAIRAASVRSP